MRLAAFLFLLVGMPIAAHAVGNATLRVVPNTTPPVFCPFSIDN